VQGQLHECPDTQILAALVLCYVDVPLHPPVFLAFPPPLLLFALNLPCRLAATANALSGMVNSDLLLLHLHKEHIHSAAIPFF
jgi:hypothetical protein